MKAPEASNRVRRVGAIALIMCMLASSTFAADGPASQQEADAWLAQVLGLVEKATGLKTNKERRPKIKLADEKEAGRVLGTEFASMTGISRHVPLPPPEALGQQILARYCFGDRTIYFLPSNVKRVAVCERFTATQRMQFLKVVLAYACDIALLDSHVPMAKVYYAPGGTDAGLAARAVWEGHARMAQDSVAKAIGADETVSVASMLNTFTIAPPMDSETTNRDRSALVTRATSMGRISEVGGRFIEALVKAKGPNGVLEALRRPPLRTSQVLVPNDYLAGEGYEPTDQDIGELLARAAGTFFPPQWWNNRSRPLGALSLADIVSADAWNRGAGPLKLFTETFDLDYVGGRSLVGERKDRKGVRASGLHVFRTERAVKRFINWKAKKIKEDWKRLEEDRFAIKDKRDGSPNKKDLSEETLKLLSGGRVLTMIATRPDGSDFKAGHYYLQCKRMVLELDLDLIAPKKLLGDAVTELASFVKKEEEEAAARAKLRKSATNE